MDALFEWILKNWNEITLAILLIVLLYGGSRPEPWWVFGWLFKERTIERNEWKKVALRGIGQTHRAVSAAEEVDDG